MYYGGNFGDSLHDYPSFTALSYSMDQTPLTAKKAPSKLGHCPPDRLPQCSSRQVISQRRKRSAAMKTAKTTEMTPFIVKKAALRRERSFDLTSECS